VIDADCDLGAIDRFLASSFVRHSSKGDCSREQWRDALADLCPGFPDLKTTIDDILAEGDKIAYRWLSDGTHLSTYMSVPATPKRDRPWNHDQPLGWGRVVEGWALWNKVSVLHDLGIIAIS
jgi:predicted ester cyclase